MHMAAQQGHPAIVDLLVAAGAHVNATDHRHNTPLHAAAGNSMQGAAVARQLLAAGATLDAPGGWRTAALHVAAQCGNQAVAEVLLGVAGTPLLLPASAAAAWKGHANVAAVLVKALLERDTTAGAAAMESLCAAGAPGIAPALAELWKADIAAVRDLDAKRMALQHLAINVAGAHQQPQASAQDITTAAVAAATQVTQASASQAVTAAASIAAATSAVAAVAEQVPCAARAVAAAATVAATAAVQAAGQVAVPGGPAKRMRIN